MTPKTLKRYRQFLEDIGSRISSMRKANKMTQTEAAEKLSVELRQYQYYENGEYLTVESLFQVCVLYKIALKDLFSDKKGNSIHITHSDSRQYTAEQLLDEKLTDVFRYLDTETKLAMLRLAAGVSFSNLTRVNDFMDEVSVSFEREKNTRLKN